MTWVNYILIDGERVPIKSLTPDQKKDVANNLNRTALTAVGYKVKGGE